MAEQYGTAYRKARAALKAKQQQPCCLCGDWIDYTLTSPAPGSFSAEHWPPVSQAGAHTNLLPAHLGCQHQQGGRIRAGQPQTVPTRTSGVW